MSPHKTYSDRIFWGLLLIMFGVLFLLDRMGRLDFGDLFYHYWPLLIILVGLWSLISNNFRDAGGGIFLIIIGAFFMLAKLEILGKSAWHYFWPLVIIAVGLWLLIKPALGRTREGFPEAKEDDLHVSGVLTGITRRVSSQNFRGGKASAIMGGLELDFTSARLAEGKATVELTTIMGGIEVRVPKDWQVVLQGTPILGGIDDKHRPAPSSGAPQTLYIKATAILGGIDIKD